MAIRPPAGYEEPAGAWVAQFVKERFGRTTLVLETTPTLGTSAAQVLKPNPRRFAWLIFNLSSGTCNFGFGTTVTSTTGFPLQPLGGGVSAQADEDGELPTNGVVGIAALASSQLYVVEVVGV